MWPPSVWWEGVIPSVGDGAGRSPRAWAVGHGCAARPRRGRCVHKLGGGVGWLGGGARRLREQVLEDRPALGRGGKLRHVRDARGQGHGGGAGAKQAPKPAAASRPASSLSKARKTLGQPRRAEATRSRPCVPRAAQAGRPHCARASQSKTPSATTAHEGAGPSRPRPSTGFGPGRDWNLGVTLRVDGPSRKPAHATARDLGDDHHAGEALAPLREQPRVPEPLLAEAGRPQGSAAARAPARSPGPGVRPSPGGCPVRRGTPSPHGCGAARRRRTGPPPSAAPGPARGPQAELNGLRWRGGQVSVGRRRAAGSPRAGSGPRGAGGSPARRRPRRSRSSTSAPCRRTP